MKMCLLLVLILSLPAFATTEMRDPMDNRHGVDFVIAGTSITILGTSAFLLGGGMALFGSDMHGITQSIGILVLSVGAGVDCIGLPLLVTGLNKRARARVGVLLPPNRDGIGLSMSLSL